MQVLSSAVLAWPCGWLSMRPACRCSGLVRALPGPIREICFAPFYITYNIVNIYVF
jgi:hypothetical protein